MGHWYYFVIPLLDYICYKRTRGGANFVKSVEHSIKFWMCFKRFLFYIFSTLIPDAPICASAVTQIGVVHFVKVIAHFGTFQVHLIKLNFDYFYALGYMNKAPSYTFDIFSCL